MVVIVIPKKSSDVSKTWLDFFVFRTKLGRNLIPE